MAGVHWKMYVRLLLIVALLWTARASYVRQTVYKRNAGMDGRQLTNTALFQASAPSILDCGIRCSREKCCRSYTYTAEQPSTCRGYDFTMTSSNGNDTVSAAGMEYFEIVIADWLEMPCTQNCECPVYQSECFKGRCLCSPGFYYSKGSNACFADCPQADLGGVFIKYPMSALNIPTSHYLTINRGRSLSGCEDLCLHSFPTCRSINYNPGDAWCGLLPLTAHHSDVGTFVDDNPANHYLQKTCA